MKKKVFLLLVILFFLPLTLYFIWTNYLWKTFSCSIAGSYECAEVWTINAGQQEVVSAIQKLTELNSDFLIKENDSIYTTYNQYLEFTFHYSDTDEKVYVVIRSSPLGNSTQIYLVALAKDQDKNQPIEKWVYSRKEINRDYEYHENKAQINKFETRILHPIKDEITRLKFGN